VYTSDSDIWALTLPEPNHGDRKSDPKPGEAKSDEAKPIQVTKTPFIEMTPRVSPDGRWVAYASNEQGEYRVYIQSFPEPGIKQPVSAGGGINPRWSRDGKELFYFTGNSYPYTGGGANVWAASIKVSGSSLTVARAEQRVPPRGVGGTTSYSVALDGRFLLQTVPGVSGRGVGMTGRPVGTTREFAAITLMLNWAAGRGQK
jgi:hypothetical protein